MGIRDLAFSIFARDRTGQAFDSVSRKLKGVAAASKTAQARMTDLGVRATAVGGSMTFGLTAPVTRFAADVAQVAGDFDAAMRRVGAVAEANAEDLERMRSAAKRLGADTQFSASQAADALGFLAQAGFSVDQALEALPNTLQLAAASSVDLGVAADVVSNILTGYKKPVSDLAHVNDVLVTAANKTNTELTGLGQAMEQAGPIASAAGVSFEEAAGAIGLLSNAGLKGSVAGTALKGALARMLNPTAAVRKEMDAAGLAFTDANGRLLPMVDILRQLEPHADDAALMLRVFGQEAGPGMAALVGQGSDALETLVGQLEASGGAAEKVAGANMEGYAGAVKGLSSAFEGLKLALADAGFLAAMTGIVKGLTSLVRIVSDAPPWLQRFGMALVGVLAVVGPLTLAAGALALAFGAISWPVLAVVAGIALLGAGVAALWPQLVKLAEFIGGGFVAAWQGLKAAFDLAMNSPIEFAQKLGSLLLSINPVVVGVKGIAAAFEALFPEVMASIKKLVAGVKEWLLDGLSRIFDAVKAKIASVGDAFYNLWDRVVGHSYIPDLVDDIGTEMRRLDGEMVDPAIDANEKVGQSFKDLAQGAIRDLLDLARKGDLTMTSFFDTVLKAGMNWADSLISNVFDKVAQGAASAMFGATGGGGGLFSGIARAFGFGGGDVLTSALAAAGVPGLDTGGDAAVVGGRGGMDRNLVRLRLSEGEKVRVTRRGEGGGGANVTVNISTPNPAAFQASRAQVAATVTRAVALGQRGA